MSILSGLSPQAERRVGRQTSSSMRYAEGIIAQPFGMICFLNLENMFEKRDLFEADAA